MAQYDHEVRHIVGVVLKAKGGVTIPKLTEAGLAALLGLTVPRTPSPCEAG
jgi:hypothetical protein